MNHEKFCCWRLEIGNLDSFGNLSNYLMTIIIGISSKEEHSSEDSDRLQRSNQLILLIINRFVKPQCLALSVLVGGRLR
jgi:hypothetical protein